MRNLTWLAIITILAACPLTQPEDFSDCRTSDGDPITIEAGATITNGVLSVPVAHGGGCGDHEYAICWPDQTFMESAPVQVALEIWHDSGGDTCEAWLSSTLNFDLGPLEAVHSDTYAGDDTLVINIGRDALEYTYER